MVCVFRIRLFRLVLATLLHKLEFANQRSYLLTQLLVLVFTVGRCMCLCTLVGR
jgi:hypothetical protein